MAQKRTVGANILQSFKLFLSRIQTRILNTINQKGRLRYHIFDNILHPMTIQSDVADMARAGATTGHYQKNWRFFLYKLGRNFLKRFEYVCVLQQRNRAARCQFAIHDAVPNFHKIIKMS